MERRKTICVVTSLPEHTQGQRVLNGVFAQCEKYGYNVAVFASMTHLLFHVKEQAKGERNIYNLINHKFFDGVILDTLTLTEDTTYGIINGICDSYEKDSKAPVVCVGMPYRDYPTVTSENDLLLREMCRHAVKVHGCKDICLLTGMKGHPESEDRLRIFLDELDKLGVPVTDEHIVYGNFWYTSGEKLADDIASGSISKPDCVIAASDHMALGLIERLTDHGINVPQEIKVIGFEGTNEAAIARIPLTSYESNFTKSAADAVDELRKLIDPGEEILPYEPDPSKMLHLGMSCGCMPDYMFSSAALRDAIYFTERNYSNDILSGGIDIGLLMENYISEQLTASETPQECLEKIFDNTYMIYPFVNFYLCLRENWLDTKADTTVGYPDKMMMVLANSSVGEFSFRDPSRCMTFDTSLMIPRMHEYTDVPCVFYFSAIHFGEKMLGYAVLQRVLKDSYRMNLVYRNWLRLVNNSLEMVRAKYRYVVMSIHDNMTGVYNRRGMYEALNKLRSRATAGDKLMVSVIDMDGLKYINDNFGHSEGDFGIVTVSRAAAKIAGENGICVRAGGDEFFVISLGRYTDESAHELEQSFKQILHELSENSGKPYSINASIGCTVCKVGGKLIVEEALSEADVSMYKAKQEFKRQSRSEG